MKRNVSPFGNKGCEDRGQECGGNGGVIPYAQRPAKRLFQVGPFGQNRPVILEQPVEFLGYEATAGIGRDPARPLPRYQREVECGFDLINGCRHGGWCDVKLCRGFGDVSMSQCCGKIFHRF